ncbi:hypothetical protein [Methanobrevibacter sp. UBA417]|jgi:hypothetical protein
MKLRSTKIRAYLISKRPINQDVRNPKVFAHLKGISGYDYCFFYFNNR